MVKTDTILGPIYTERQWVSAMSLELSIQLIAYRFPNTSRELLWNGLQLQIDLECKRGWVDADAQCKWTLTRCKRKLWRSEVNKTFFLAIQTTLNSKF